MNKTRINVHKWQRTQYGSKYKKPEKPLFMRAAGLFAGFVIISLNYGLAKKCDFSGMIWQQSGSSFSYLAGVIGSGLRWLLTGSPAGAGGIIYDTGRAV